MLRKGRAIFYSLLVSIMFFTSCSPKDKEAQPAPVPEKPAPQPSNPGECITQAAADNGQAIAGKYIVEQKAGEEISVNSLPRNFSRLHISSAAIQHLYKTNLSRIYAMKLSEQQAEELKKDPAIQSVEPDRIISITSCNTEIAAQSIPWGINRTGHGDGTGKTVWIIDTGVDLDHPDLNVDRSLSKSFIGTNPDDDNGHGTHVAGTIAAKNDLVGVVGVAANARIVALKVMDADGRGSSSDVIKAVNYISNNAKAGDVVNMSIGGGSSELLDKAVTDAANKGILFAIAAGNDGYDASQDSPAKVNHPNVFTVSAMNSEDSFASFSNYGPAVDYCAPGVNIPSTFKNGKYATMSGTSMATPHVAGLLLLKGTRIITDGFVKNDPDSIPDPIAHK